MTHVQNAVQLVHRACGASRKRRIRLPHPVTHRHAERVDALFGEAAKVGLGDPFCPVLSQLPISLLLPENPAEAEHVERRLIFRLVLKLVEQTRRHPWLQNEPPAQVDAAHFVLEEIVRMAHLLVRRESPPVGQHFLCIAHVLRDKRSQLLIRLTRTSEPPPPPPSALQRHPAHCLEPIQRRRGWRAAFHRRRAERAAVHRRGGERVAFHHKGGNDLAALFTTHPSSPYGVYPVAIS